MCPSGLNTTSYTAPGSCRGWPNECRVGRVGDIPQPHGGILAAGGQRVPVGTERQTPYVVVGLALQGLAEGLPDAPGR